MRKIFIVLIFTNLLFTYTIISQERGNRLGGKIKGIVIDSDTQNPIEYSNIVLHNLSDSVFIAGTVTNKNGEFELERIKPGEFYIEVRFMGYKSEIISYLNITSQSRVIDVGNVELKLQSINVGDVEVVAERSGIEYKIDKKVVNVSKHYTAASGNAVDVLENVPSVSVDVEGNVSLRGSGNFTLLIDNRPTVLDPNDALQQIPASTIEDIEIITNPSARFDPDGPSGIINLITKKEGFSGSSGIINLNGGLDEKYGGDFLFNYKTGIITTYFGADYNKRFMPGNSESRNITSRNDLTSFINSDGNSNSGRTFYGVRGGLDFNFDKSNSLGFSFRYGNMDFNSSNNLNYQSWTSLSDQRELFKNKRVSERIGDFLSFSADYRHAFNNNGHEITGSFSFQNRDMEELSTNKLFDEDGNIYDGNINTEDGPSGGYRANIDYRLPLSETNKFEFGYQNRLGNSTDNTSYSYYDKNAGDFILDDLFTRDIDYKRYIHSFYTLYSAETGNFGYQGGIRAEYTDRIIELKKNNEQYIIDRWDYYPNVHFSYKLNNANQFMASYTKRVERPRGWNLEPFDTWEDAYSIRRGNPDLQPEDIDSYEAGYQHYFGKNLFSLEAYYRVTHDKIEYIRSVYDNADFKNVILTTVENVGKDYSFGTELMLDFNFTDWWKLNLMGDIYNYQVEGSFGNQEFSRESSNWRARFNNSFNLSKSSRIQFNNSYNSKTVSSQGTREGFFTTSLAIRYVIFENLTATLQFRDLFSTAKNEFTSEGPNFYRYEFSTRKAPMVMLNLNFNINNYKQDKRDSNDINGSQGEGDDF